MKDHKEETRYISLYDFDGCGIEEAYEVMKKKAKNLIDPKITTDPYGDWIIKGWRPMTEKEKERSRKASERAKASAARKKELKEAAERREYERLAKKYA